MSAIKKILAFTFVLAMLSAPALASVDISGLSFDELVSLVNEAQFAMMKTDKWQEVTVPAGVYEVGKDIPAGKWNISAFDNSQAVVYVGYSMSDDFNVAFEDFAILAGKNLFPNAENEGTQSIVYNLKDGMFIKIQNKSVIFTPYQGNNFSFK